MDRASEGFHDLVRRAQGGDRRAMDQVLSILRPFIEPLARRYAESTRPAESTADLLQESCLRAWSKIGGFEGGTNDEETFAMFRAWIGRIVRTKGLNAQDRQRGRRNHTARVAARLPVPRTLTPAETARSREMGRQVREALMTVADETDLRIIELRFFDGMTLPQISHRIGVDFKEVRRRYRLALRRLQRRLTQAD